MCGKVVGTIGLSFDIIGAFLVAVEVVKVYHGNISGTVDGPMGKFGKRTPEFEEHEKQKRTWMKFGLFFLVSGFILQIDLATK